MPRAEQSKVEPGQVWADNDKRSKGRMIRVDKVWATGAGVEYVTATVVANDNRTQARIDGAVAPGLVAGPDQRGKQVRIMVRRMRPNSTGYRLEHEADPRLPGFPLCSCSRSADAHENDCPQVLYSPDDI